MPKKVEKTTKSLKKSSSDEKSNSDKENCVIIESAEKQDGECDEQENSDKNIKNNQNNAKQEEKCQSPPSSSPTPPPPPRADIIETSVLKDLLECPVCLRVPRSSPIYQCARGHVVCAECKQNVNTCPQCRDVLGNIRSLVSEKVLEKLPTPCKYSDSGCKVELMRSELSSHEKECRYRPVNCVDLACQQSVSLANLLNHLDSDHETEDFVRVEGGEYSSHFIVNEEDFSKDIMWISDQLHLDEKYFYRECCRSNKGLWYIWVYELDPGDKQESQYTCQICVFSADQQDKLTCTSTPLSLDYTKEKVAESGRGLVFTDNTARYFLQDNKVRYSVNITRRT